MNRTRNSLIFVLVALLAVFSAAAQAVTPGEWADRLGAIEDQRLRTTIENSINAGLISNVQEFDTAVSRAVERQFADNPAAALNRGHGHQNNHNGNNGNNGNSGGNDIRQIITSLATPLAQLDRDAIRNVAMDGSGRGNLFKDLAGALPPSYEATFKLAEKFDPRVGFDCMDKLDGDVDAYLNSIANDPCIQYALKQTGTTLKDLKATWFGQGDAFKHVICGEVKGGDVSGYHFWYKFYRDERQGEIDLGKTFAINQFAYTGQFEWDPDGKGPMPSVTKDKGGFIVGNSAQAILALGHLAIETAKKYGKAPASLDFDANINGQSFRWQMYCVNGNLRTLYPKAPAGAGRDAKQMISDYYKQEADVLQKNRVSGNLTVH